MTKGLEFTGIALIHPDGDRAPGHDWFADASRHLVDTRSPRGYWWCDFWGGRIPSTGWALLTQEVELQDIVTALAEVSDGDVLVLHLTGSLREEAGGTPVLGGDGWSL